MAIASFLFVSCDCEDNSKEAEKTENVVVVAQKIDINKFDAQADGLADKLVEITGTCMHTCSHGGTKMFIAGTDPDFRLKITATDESGNFNQEMEGKDYVVIGILDEYRMDMAEIDKMEADVLAEHGVEIDSNGDVKEKDMKHKGHKDGGGHDVEHAEEEGSCAAELTQIADLRAEVKETGKGYLSFYSVLAESYKEVK